MSEKEAKDLAIKAIRSASLRDSFSGDGIDMLVINKQGSTMTTEKIN
jgi:proteasome beta subunit